MNLFICFLKMRYVPIVLYTVISFFQGEVKAQDSKLSIITIIQEFESIPDLNAQNDLLSSKLEENKDPRNQSILKLAHAKCMIDRSFLKSSFTSLYDLNIEEIQQDPYLEASYNLVKARLDYKLGKLDKAIEENNKAYQLFSEDSYVEEANLAAINHAFYITLKDRKKTLDWLKKGSKTKENRLLFYSNYAFYFLVDDQLDSAKYYIKKAQNAFETRENYLYLDDYRIQILMATIAEKRGDRATENQNLLQAQELCEKFGMLENLREVLNALSHNFEEEQKAEKALVYARKADSVGQLLPNQMLSEEMIRLDLGRRMEEIKEKKDLVQERLQNEQQRNKLILLSSLVFLIGFISVLFLWIKNKRKTKSLIQKNLELTKCEKPIHSKVKKNVDTVLIEKLQKLVIEKEEFQNPNLTLDKLAKKLGTNRTYLSESINAYFNQNYNRWINEIRISKARNLLVDPSYQHYSIEGVAKEVGYSSISVFNSSFKKITGITPSQLRKGVLSN